MTFNRSTFSRQDRRLQGRETDPSDTDWIGLSLIVPGGGKSSSASNVEKFYVVHGELEVRGDDAEGTSSTLLRPLDSCRIAPGETRTLLNVPKHPCRVLQVMPNV